MNEQAKTNLQYVVESAMEAGEIDLGDQPVVSLKTIISRIESKGRIEKIAVSKTYKTAEGSFFTSRTVGFTDVDEYGNEVGGLTPQEAAIATQIVSLRVEQDAIRRAVTSGYISQSQSDNELRSAKAIHARMMKNIFEGSK